MRKQARRGVEAIGFTILMGLVALGATNCGDDQFANVALGDLLVTPNVLSFDSFSLNTPVVSELRVENIGSGQLTISSIAFETSSTEFELVGGVTLPFVLSAGEERIIQVQYTPTDCRQDRGNLTIASSELNVEVQVPLQPAALTGQVRVNPNPIDFGRVVSGTMKTITVDIANGGTCPLNINDVWISGSFDFALTQAAGDGVMPFQPEPFTLDSSQTYQVDVTYSPEFDGFDEAVLRIRSDDAINRSVDVPIVANGEAPCITVTDEDGVNFGERFIGETHQKTITITNCSEQENLEVYSVTLTEHPMTDGLEFFGTAQVPTMSDTEPLIILPQQSSAFILEYTPVLREPQTPDGALLTVVSNDEAKTPLPITVEAIGTDNHCPVAIARARVQGTTAWNTIIDTIPLATVEFDGSQSNDAQDTGGAISEYIWEVVEQPIGSNAFFQPDGSDVDPTLFMDNAGTWRVSLNVVDNTGTISCEPAFIDLLVTPNERIHVELTWETPGDLNRMDTGRNAGTDVDLHFLHPTGSWDGAPWDVYYWNLEPNWGNLSSTADDPSLDRDDTDGWGPENLNWNEPEGDSLSPMQYSVGVYYFNDWDFGPSDTKIRVFLDGVQQFESIFFGLENRQFWDACRIEWPSQEIVRTHVHYPGGIP